MRRDLALGLTLFAVYAVGLGMHAQPGSRLTAAEAHVLMTAASKEHDAMDAEYRDTFGRIGVEDFPALGTTSRAGARPRRSCCGSALTW